MSLQRPRHAFNTVAISVDDDPAAQAFSDYDIVCDAVKIAGHTKIRNRAQHFNDFPGEHYRLLAGLLTILRPERLIDIGTFTGMSSRVMLDFGDEESKVITYDIERWDQMKQGTVLIRDDFDKGRLTQYQCDLSKENLWEQHRSIFERAQFIMLDGPKDDTFENFMLNCISGCDFKKPTYLFMDDIRFENQLANWRRIQSPKIDLTSFGHFSGSGFVNITGGLKLDEVK